MGFAPEGVENVHFLNPQSPDSTCDWVQQGVEKMRFLTIKAQILHGIGSRRGSKNVRFFDPQSPDSRCDWVRQGVEKVRFLDPQSSDSAWDWLQKGVEKVRFETLRAQILYGICQKASKMCIF